MNVLKLFPFKIIKRKLWLSNRTLLTYRFIYSYVASSTRKCSLQISVWLSCLEILLKAGIFSRISHRSSSHCIASYVFFKWMENKQNKDFKSFILVIVIIMWMKLKMMEEVGSRRAQKGSAKWYPHDALLSPSIYTLQSSIKEQRTLLGYLRGHWTYQYKFSVPHSIPESIYIVLVVFVSNIISFQAGESPQFRGRHGSSSMAMNTIRDRNECGDSILIIIV